MDLNISREVVAAPGMHTGAVRGMPETPVMGTAMGPGGYPAATGVHGGMGAGPNLSRPNMGVGRDMNHMVSMATVPVTATRPSIESVIEQRRMNNPQEVCFSVAKSIVGAVIGKGGQHLRDIQTEFGVRVYIEKEDFGGKRLVVLSYANSPAEGTETDSNSAAAAIQRCKDHIEHMIEEQIKQKQAGATDANATASSPTGENTD